MRRNEGIIVSVRLPKAVVQYIDDQVDTVVSVVIF